jgi:hypothetical protein
LCSGTEEVTPSRDEEDGVAGRGAFALQGRGAYVVQATIASLHTQEPRDWTQIAALHSDPEPELIHPFFRAGSAQRTFDTLFPYACGDSVETGLCRACWSLLHPWIVRRVGVRLEALSPPPWISASVATTRGLPRRPRAPLV